jgi:hypothetical protein
VNHRQINEAFDNRSSLLVILAQASKAVQPAKGAFDNPAFWLHNKAALFSTHRNLCFNPKDLLTLHQQRVAGIAAIKDKQLQAFPQRQALQQPFCRHFILLIGGMNHDPQQPTLGINRYLAFAAFLAFKRVKSTSPLFSAVCTDWLSTMTTLGSASRSSATRTSTRNTSLIRSKLLRSTKRRQKAYTLEHAGKSWGNIRHWQPVRVKYNRALTISRRLWMASRPRFFCGSNGSILDYCSSLKSVG